MISIVCVGIYSLITTNFQIHYDVHDSEPPLEGNIRWIFMATANFSPLLGMLCVGFFLHPLSLPIIKNNAKQENNLRDVFAGYMLVFLSFVVVGVMGYIGFKGTYFREYFMKAGTNTINQVCLNMFQADDPIGFILRFAVFCLLFCTFPLVNHFLRSLVVLVCLTFRFKLAFGRPKT